MRLKDKVALITGAGLGMGREASTRFAREGAKVVVFDRNAETGRETVDMVEAAGGSALFVEGDASVEDDVRGAVERAMSEYGALHVLYANAGVLWKDKDKSVTDTTVEDWDRVQAINLRGPFLLAKHGIGALEASGGGSILFVGSISALVGFELAQDSYTAAKSALVGLAKSIAVQYGPKNIRCNIIHPGMIDTPLQAPYLDDAAKRSIAEALPIRRLGVASDVANAALFLASDEAGFVTGAELIVDGGFIAT